MFYGDSGNAGRIVTTRCEWSLKESTIHQSHYVPHNMMYYQKTLQLGEQIDDSNIYCICIVQNRVAN